MYNNWRIRKTGMFVGSISLIAAMFTAGLVQASGTGQKQVPVTHLSKQLSNRKANGATRNAKFIIPKSTFSPNNRYGVTAPIFDPMNINFKDIPNNNKLIEIYTGRVLTDIQGETGYNRSYGHRRTLPARWSADSSSLVWEVGGKWSASTLTLLQIKNGQVIWQRNLLKLAQNAILYRTRKAAPQKYAAAKKANAGNGSAFPDGFTVDEEVIGKISFPLHVRMVLTSNPKLMENIPELDSYLEAIVDKRGQFKVTGFKLGNHPSQFIPWKVGGVDRVE